MKRWVLACTLCCFVFTAAPVRGQDPPARPAPGEEVLAPWELPPAVAERLIEFYNAPQTIHFSGPSRVPAERTITGDVAVLGGPFTIAGRVEGDVLVINGDLELLPGGAVTGGVTVVGGRTSGLEDASIDGEVVTYSELLRYRQRGDQLVYAGPLGRRGAGPADGEGWLAQRDFLITTGQSYNRVEGLPITFGPVIETRSANPLRLRALGIYRTEAGLSLDLDDMGYYVRAEQFLGGHRALRIGASAYSMVDPIEAWHLSKLENGLATFLLHRDYRDHYEREGGSVFVTLEPRRSPLSLTLEGRSERNTSVPVGSPWTLFRNDAQWRPQPLVAEGRLRSLAGRVAYDTRSQAEDPAIGWHFTGEVERSLTANLTRPELVRIPILSSGEPERIPAQRYGGFTVATADLRRYNRLSPEARLNFRLRMGGSLDGSALPPQRQHALGGEGSLPGYDLFRFDCGARDAQVFRAAALEGGQVGPGISTPRFVGGYGCDAFALFQAEFRNTLNLRLRWDEDPWGREPREERGGDRWFDLAWLASPEWAAFLDVGRGWAFDGGSSEKLAADVGVGLLIANVGVYVAVPLVEGRGMNLFVRLGPRF